MADTDTNTSPTDAQKGTLKGIVKEAVKEILAEERAASTDKQRTTGKDVETTDKPKSFFEFLGLG